jgi:putative SOS response-associated peptidase YedK
MCGRYTRKAARDLIYKHFGIEHDEFSEIRLEPSFDVRPGTVQPVVRLGRDGERILSPMRWGFKLEIQKRKKLVFNTKSENVMESGLWRKRFAETRCIVPASSFLEWPNKLKTEISLKDCAVFGFAGLYGTWSYADGGQPEPTFSIFTTEPNTAMRAIHRRQPAILKPTEYEEWLTPSERPPLHLLRIFSEEDTVITPVDVQRQATLF